MYWIFLKGLLISKKVLLNNKGNCEYRPIMATLKNTQSGTTCNGTGSFSIRQDKKLTKTESNILQYKAIIKGAIECPHINPNVFFFYVFISWCDARWQTWSAVSYLALSTTCYLNDRMQKKKKEW